jgi:hypothetical protein
MVNTASAPDLRRWALRCKTQASDRMCSGEEREQLMRMYSALLELAENADWLEGKMTPPLRRTG